jgi:hypothetical protein
MANAFNIPDLLAREALKVAHEKSVFIGTVDRQYDASFKSQGGWKPGDQLRVANPNMYTRTRGSRVMDVQDQVESSQTITVATQDHVDMRFNSAELALVTPDNIGDFSDRYIVPAMSALVSGIEGDFISYATKRVYNTVGTPGTPPSDLAAIGAARAKLNQNLAPKDGNRYVMLDSVTSGGLVNGLKGLFQDSTQIKEQYREGMLGRTGGADFYENERMYAHTNSSDVTGATDAAALVTDGGATIDMHTLIASPAVGSVFTVAGVYACHPETKQAYSHLQQFTVITTSAGGAITVSPTIYLTGPRQNVASSASAQLATTAFNAQVVTFVGNASATYLQNLMYHKDAFQFITADLPLMGGSHNCARRVQDGLSLRVWFDGDIRNDELLCRIDILYGMAALRPEWACRITN